MLRKTLNIATPKIQFINMSTGSAAQHQTPVLTKLLSITLDTEKWGDGKQHVNNPLLRGNVVKGNLAYYLSKTGYETG